MRAVLSSVRPAPPLAPDLTGRTRTRGHQLLALALISGMAAVTFPFSPVQQPVVDYSWTASDGPAALPLMPYQPIALTATTNCDAARDEGVLLSTVPLQPDPDADPLAGLRMIGSGDGLQVSSAGVELGKVALPPGMCTVTVDSDPDRTVVSVDGVPALTHTGDVRPDVAGAFSDRRAGVELTLTADTRFQTTMSPLKAAVGALCLLALLAMFLVLAAADRSVAPRRVRLLPRRWWVPRPVDVAVGALLGVWWVVGSITVDDGYIAGIVRSRGQNGFVGNVYRWLNAPEAPFSWFYELLYQWSLVSPSTPWMRLPSVVLGLVTWLLLSRALLPRFGVAADRPWLAALAFGTWWVPFDLGLRPEPWVAVGLLLVVLAVERAVALRRLLPMALGLLAAAMTTALTPGGVIAFTPFVAAGVPLLRLLRARRDLPRLTVLAVAAASAAAAVLVMVFDQSLGGLLEATRVRQLIGGGVEWYQEYERYSLLLEPSSFQASIGRRAAVLTTVLAAVGVLWALDRGPRVGLASGPTGRAVVTLLLSLAVMTATPTKWTQHFGTLAGLGAAVLVAGAVAWTSAPWRARPQAFTAALAAATTVGALVLAGQNSWPYASSWFDPTFSTLPPQVAGIRVTSLFVVAGLVVVGALAVRAARRRAAAAPEVDVPRRVPGPVPVLALVLVAVLALQVLGLARIAVEHRDSYTLASDAVRTVRGEPCGLQERLGVETDPAAGLLRAGTAPAAPASRPVDIGGHTLPGVAVSGSATTAWFDLDAVQLDGSLPVVVTTSGRVRPGDELGLEFGDAQGAVLERRRLDGSDGPRDSRQMAPAGAVSTRLVVDADPTDSPALVTLPRVPRLTPMEQLLPPGSTAILDWPVAFLFPCVNPEPLTLGTAGLARWRVASPAGDPSGEITYSPGFGGPFTAPRLLVTEQRMATYLDGDPVRDAAQLVRWVPVGPLARLEPIVTERTVPGWSAVGRARVPGLDPVG